MTTTINTPLLFTITPSGPITVITGANSGIGYESSTMFLRSGHSVILACRNKKAGNDAAKKMARSCVVPDSFVTCVQLDLADLSSVKSFKTRLLKVAPEIQQKGVNNLINNAGVGWGTQTIDRVETKDGFESFFQVNYLGHYLLCKELMPLLVIGGNRTSLQSRIINVSSSLHDPDSKGNRKNTVKINLDDMNSSTEEPFSAKAAYCRSKLMQIMFTYELQRRLRLHQLPIVCSCLNPGFIPSTGLIRNSGVMAKFFLRWCLGGLLRSCCLVTRTAEDGGFCIYLVTTQVEAGEGGQYFEYTRMKTLNAHSSSMDSYDQHLQAQLWKKSCQLLSIPIDWVNTSSSL